MEPRRELADLAVTVPAVTTDIEDLRKIDPHRIKNRFPGDVISGKSFSIRAGLAARFTFAEHMYVVPIPKYFRTYRTRLTSTRTCLTCT